MKNAFVRDGSMKKANRNIKHGLALVCVAALLFPHASAHAQRSKRRGNATKGALVFVVSGDFEEKILDALAVVAGGEIKAPYAEQDMAAARRFSEKHFRAGTKYRMTFGGGDAGTFSVKSATDGCNNYHASGDAQTSANIRGRVMALATDSAKLGEGASARRAPEAQERAAVLALVNKIFRERRTPAAELPKITVTNMTATDLDRDGRYEIVGSFALESKGNRRRDLFLIAASEGEGFRADFVHFQSYHPPIEGFNSSVDFVDQLDMDGDGVGEVVTLDGGFDAYGYSIYRKKRGRWSRVLRMIGDAC